MGARLKYRQKYVKVQLLLVLTGAYQIIDWVFFFPAWDRKFWRKYEIATVLTAKLCKTFDV